MPFHFSINYLTFITTNALSMNNHTAWVYILSNRIRTTLYIGVTTAISNRILQHKLHKYPTSFTARYNVTVLVYYEGFDTVVQAIGREKYLKGKRRSFKEELINSVNPARRELTPPC
jgi:putative endonuclease